MVTEFPQFALSASYACYCVTASYSVTASYAPWYVKPEAYVPPKDAGVEEFFESLGYDVGHDGRRWGQQWFNILKDDHLVCQVDQGVPLTDIVMDMAQWHLGKDGISDNDWTCSGPDSPELRELFKKVYEYKVEGKLPTDHLTYEI